MTAQEKAYQLYGKYRSCQLLPFFAKKCALIAVDEIEKALTEYGRANDELQNMDREFNYWQEVRKEIEKL